MKKKGRKGKIIIAILLAVLICLIFFVTNQNVDKNLRREANKIVKYINNTDIDKLQYIITGVGSVEYDTELEEYFNDTEKNSEEKGLIYFIVEEEKAKIKRIDKDYIEYEIEVPDTSNIFEDMNNSDVSNEKIDKYLEEYIKNADKIKVNVKVSYTYVDGKFKADYSTEEFVNAVTGNLVTTYQQMLHEMINEESGVDVKWKK